jgi:hypothetical protein
MAESENADCGKRKGVVPASLTILRATASSQITVSADRNLIF